MRLRSIPSLTALFAASTLLLLAGCGQFFPPNTDTGSGTSTSSTSDFLFTGNVATLGIASFGISSSGLAAVSGSPFSTGITPVALAVSRNNEYLYASGGGADFEVDAYTIGSTGALSAGTAYTGVGPSALRVDTTGDWLIGSDSEAGEVYAFAIDPSTGVLTEPDSTSVALLPGCSPTVDVPAGLPAGLAISSGDNYVYASCGTAGVYALSFNSSTGVLTELGQVKPASTDGADSGLAIATTSSASYLIAAETVTNGVRVFTIGSTGGLTALGSPVATGTAPDAVLVDATNSYVYVANRNPGSAGTISAFTLAASGALTSVGSATSTGLLPVAMVEDNTKAYIAVACAGGSSDLETYSIGTGGALTSFYNSATGTDPTTASSIAATH